MAVEMKHSLTLLLLLFAAGACGGSVIAADEQAPLADRAPDAEPSAIDTDGGGPCGTYAFGHPEVGFQPAFAHEVIRLGEAIPSGVYDAVFAESAPDSTGSLRETFAAGADGRFTRVRRIDRASITELTYRAGTYRATRGRLAVLYDCAIDDRRVSEADIGPEVPYEVVTVHGEVHVVYSLGGARVWLRRR